jgi:hypothetical protein
MKNFFKEKSTCQQKEADEINWCKLALITYEKLADDVNE